jgi:hypothetical protein
MGLGELKLTDDCKVFLKDIIGDEDSYHSGVLPAVWFDHPDLPPYEDDECF